MPFETVVLSPEVTVYRGDAGPILGALAEPGYDAIIADPPYNGVLDVAWDNAWQDRAAFLTWLERHLIAWHAALRHTGSLFCFAYPHLAAYVEVAIGEHFNVLNHIVWHKKNGGAASRGNKAMLRAFIPLSERIIFAEHYGADDRMAGAADQLRGQVFEPLRVYLDTERQRAGVSPQQIQEYFAARGWPRYVVARHAFSASQWALPTAENYARLRQCLNELGQQTNTAAGDYLPREYAYLRREYDSLRREYDRLRREYESLRRPFSVTATVPYSDVWSFNTSCSEGSYHPAQKPLALMRHIIYSSTRPGDLILDPFMGSGTTGVACLQTGRRFVGIERDPAYFATAVHRLRAAARQPRLWTGPATGAGVSPAPAAQLALVTATT